MADGTWRMASGQKQMGQLLRSGHEPSAMCHWPKCPIQSEPVSRVLSWAIISLGCGLPAQLDATDPDVKRNEPLRDRMEPRGSLAVELARRANPRGSIRSSPCLVLLPVGFALPVLSPEPRCALTAPFHPYREAPCEAARRFVFCGTVPVLADGGCYPPPCPVEPGLSSIRVNRTAIAWPALDEATVL